MLIASLNKTIPSFSDLAPVEHVWDEMWCQLQTRSWPPPLRLEAAFLHTPNNLPQVCFQRRVNSIRCHQWWSRGYGRPGPNTYGRPYWCSRNTFESEIAAIVKVPPAPLLRHWMPSSHYVPQMRDICITSLIWKVVWKLDIFHLDFSVNYHVSISY